MHLTERRDSTARMASEAEVDDITGIMSYLDSKDHLQSVLFAARGLSRCPGYSPG